MRIASLRTSKWVVVALAICGAAPAAADDLCDELEKFENAPLLAEAEHVRWIEVRWIGSWMSGDGWGFACTGSDEVGTALCRFVVRNTSYEFASAFPIRILECHGFDLPPATSIANWQAEIEVQSAEDRRHEMIVDLGDRENDSGAVRYVTVGHESAGGLDVEYLPIAALPSDEETE